MATDRDTRQQQKPQDDAAGGADAGIDPPSGTRHAVVIGIDQYIDGRITNLQFAGADAEGIYRILIDPALGRFPEENVTLLVNGQATLRKIRSEIGTHLKRRAGPDDLVCIYFAGHGAIDPDPACDDGLQKYLVPHDGEADDLFSTGIPMTEIQTIFQRLHARQVLFFIDSCYSGGANGRTFQNPRQQTRSILTQGFLDELAASNTGRFVVTSCSPNEVSLESPELDGGHGVFTHFLIKALAGEADKDQDGLVTMNELFEYLSENVADCARQLGGVMTPIKTGSTQGRIFLTQYETVAQKQAKELMQEAEDVYRADDLETAAAIAHRVLDLVPEHEAAIALLSAIAEQQATQMSEREEAERLAAQQQKQNQGIIFQLFQDGRLPAEEYNRALKLLAADAAELPETDQQTYRLLTHLLDGSLEAESYLTSVGLLYELPTIEPDVLEPEVVLEKQVALEAGKVIEIESHEELPAGAGDPSDPQAATPHPIALNQSDSPDSPPRTLETTEPEAAIAAKKRRGWQRYAVWLVALIGACAMAWVVFSQIATGAQVPGVVGDSEQVARRAIESAGLTHGRITKINSDSVPAGQIVGMNPAAGTSVEPDSAVDLTISLGPAKATVPSVAGMSETEAKLTLAEANLRPGRSDKVSSDAVPVGHIIRTDPAVHSEVEQDSTINLVVSSGAEKLIVPDVVRTSDKDAESSIKSAGFDLGIIDRTNSDSIPAGHVIRTNPAPGASVVRDTAIDLTISLGPEKLAVPDVVGKSATEAKRVIEAANLNPGRTNNRNSDSVPTGQVISMDPSAGVSVAKDSTVNLTISSGPMKVAVPDVVGKSATEARRSIAQANLKSGDVHKVISDSVPAGQVISLNPAAGVSVAPGSAVNMTISSALTQTDQSTTQFDESLPQRGYSFRDALKIGGDGPEMIVIPAGEFEMGDLANMGSANEQPIRSVALRRNFALSIYEVTFDQYERFLNATMNPDTPDDLPRVPDDEGWGRKSRPAINVSWENAQAYVSWLSEQTGKVYRLPSEAEWEYAARAGTDSPFYTGDCLPTKFANFKADKKLPYDEKSRLLSACQTEKKFRKKTIPVGSLEENPFGLYDIHGNVYEWLQDCWNDNYVDAPADGSAWETGKCQQRVMRGGSWNTDLRNSRSASRATSGKNSRLHIIGFRIARDLQSGEAKHTGSKAE